MIMLRMMVIFQMTMTITLHFESFKCQYHLYTGHKLGHNCSCRYHKPNDTRPSGDTLLMKKINKHHPNFPSCQWFCMIFVDQMMPFKLTHKCCGPTIVVNFLMMKLDHSGKTRSILWLLMAWLLASPDHQWPWYWLSGINKPIRGRFSTTCTTC